MCNIYIYMCVYYIIWVYPRDDGRKKKKPNPTTRKHDRIGCYFIIIIISIHYNILFLHTRLP